MPFTTPLPGYGESFAPSECSESLRRMPAESTGGVALGWLEFPEAGGTKERRTAQRFGVSGKLTLPSLACFPLRMEYGSAHNKCAPTGGAFFCWKGVTPAAS